MSTNKPNKLCYLGLGSNLRSPLRQVRQAIKKLRKLPRTQVVACAHLYKTQAVGRKAQPNYCNTVIALQTSLKPSYLLRCCQKIERQQGRVRKVRWGARTLDIDILLFASRRISQAHLSIPHPQLYQRDFVLRPLSELKH